jgi:2-polyprenyl-6-methoxyphenol hydroxylase-like FAD-dependent oxidoreductase
MHHQDETDVLVVGAGPVGLLTALLLSKNGIRVKIIDKEQRTTTHSYACALHPRSLEILHRAGLLGQVRELGQRVDTLVFYEGAQRCGEIRFSQLPVEFPFALVLPQSSLEAVLERALADSGRGRVNWNHRLSRLQLEPNAIVAVIDELEQTSEGYAVPTWGWAVRRTVETRAAFVVGADGRDSQVRQLLGFERVYASAPELFAIYEFKSEGKFDDEACIVFDQSAINIFWPLGDGRGRWSFQAVGNWLPDESLAKERSVFRIVQPAVDQATQQNLHRLIEKLAPWFKREISEVYWSAEAEFQPFLVNPFGQGRCWLAGDAAHQAGPAGAQSMNLGLAEASELAETMAGILRDKGSLNLLESYNKKCRAPWERLVGTRQPLKLSEQAKPWVSRRAADILRCVPASGDALSLLLGQLGLDLQPTH